VLRVNLTEGGGRRPRSYVIRFGGREISCPGRCAYLTLSIPPGVLYIDYLCGSSRPTWRMVYGDADRRQRDR